jgi:hypothetical protein
LGLCWIMWNIVSDRILHSDQWSHSHQHMHLTTIYSHVLLPLEVKHQPNQILMALMVCDLVWFPF